MKTFIICSLFVVGFLLVTKFIVNMTLIDIENNNRRYFVQTCLGNNWNDSDNIQRCNDWYDRYKYHNDHNWKE